MINLSVLFMIPQWGIIDGTSSGGYPCCDRCIGIFPFPTLGGLATSMSSCDVITVLFSFFPFPLFPSCPPFITNVPPASVFVVYRLGYYCLLFVVPFQLFTKCLHHLCLSWGMYQFIRLLLALHVDHWLFPFFLHPCMLLHAAGVWDGHHSWH